MSPLDHLPSSVLALLEFLADKPNVAHDAFPPELHNAVRIALREGFVETQTAGVWGQALKHDAYRGLLGRAYWLSALGKDVLALLRERQADAENAEEREAQRRNVEQLTQPPADEDGLLPKSWDRTAWEELQPLQRRLLKHMLAREKDTIENIADAVWGADVNDGTIRTAISRVNEFLRKQRDRHILIKPRGEGMVRWDKPRGA